jgi:Asp-tRNA(Asn)/Glu-tRNA(Gln) amidotransferase A subunit family amidase
MYEILEDIMDELLKLSLIDLTEMIQKRKTSPVELMEAVLSRVEETNPELNTVVAMREHEALLADARRSEERVMSGDAQPLEGIPLGVKDLEDVKGLVTSQGSLPFRSQVAEHDSTQVSRLRRAGAIVLGKTNTPEFGHTAITKNLVYGVTRSPWNLERTPGGSSGGSAAALSGCILPLVTASDGGGSIRIPASFTGAFGLKPSFGRVPRGPFKQWSYAGTSVYGPLTKTVEDAALFMDQVVGHSTYDPNSLPHPGISYLESVRKPLSDALRIGYSPDLGNAVVQSDIASAVEEASREFGKMGHRVERMEGGPPLIGSDWNLISSFENASRLYSLLHEHEEDFTKAFLDGVKRAWDMTPERWGEAAQKRNLVNDWCAEIFNSFDLIITPTVPIDPVPAKGPFPEETEGRQQVPAGVAVFTVPFNQSGHPAATVRIGLSNAGLPMGMQIVGRRYREDLVLQAARAFENERPWHPQWPTSW